LERKIISHAGDLRVAKAFADLMHHGGFATALFESLHLLYEVLAGQTGQSWNSRLFNRAAFAAMAIGAHGGIGALMKFFSFLSVRKQRECDEEGCG